jgi:WD40 repeat protein
VLEAVERVEATTGLADEPGLKDLMDSLDHWPPTSYEGLKAALPFVLGLADESKPIVLMLDALDELSISDDARDLDWLPIQIPPFAKIIMSTAPSSNLNPTFTIVSAMYPESPAVCRLEVPALVDDDVHELIAALHERDSRTLIETQRNVWLEKCRRSKMPLYIHTSWNLCAKLWTSEETSINSCRRQVASENVAALLEDFLEGLEERLGRCFVGRALGYITAAKRGLSKMELADVLSCDEEVMGEVYKMVDPPIRRIPPLLIVRLLEELGSCLVERQVDGVNALFWAHEQFKRVAQDLYLDRERAISIHASLADYWEGKWAKTPKPYVDSRTQTQQAVLRYIIDQSPLIAGKKPNSRRLAALVWHQLEGGITGFQDAAKTLQDLTHVGGAIEAGLIWDLLASFRAALAKDSADGLLLPQLVDYYRFLLAHADTLVADPTRLLPAAANLYRGSSVADDARKWIAANAPGFSWAEWVNRPSARGEPLATLKGTDGGGSPMDRMLVTGRDTYGEKVVLVGVRADGRRGASLYDTAEIQAAPSGGGFARLLAKTIVTVSQTEEGEAFDDEEEYPLICVFSRRGHQILLAGRSIVSLDGNTLERKGVGKDPELPEGDVITAAAWSKEDGCIVTSSDGQEPGRLVLWNADTFTVLRVIKTQYPRQPIASSYGTLGFWDEYRSLFILLDVDELAEDAESGLFLQYIPSTPHTDPPPDGPARFGLAHRATLVLVASDDGKGYVLIDYKAKKPLARLPMEVDNVRQVAVSHDGRKVAVVPNDNKVIFVFALHMPETPNDTMGTFRLIGTVLGVDPSMASGDASSTSCLFSRSGNTVLTDGENDAVVVWDSQDLGDHSILRFRSVLPNLNQGLSPIVSSAATQPIGWSVTEGPIDVSLADASGRARVRSHRIAVETNPRHPKTLKKDIVLGIATHPTKPFIGTVTDLGTFCLLAADRMPDEPGTWVGALWSTAFGKGVGKDDDGRLFTFNVKAAGAQSSPTCIAFLPTSATSITSPTMTTSQSSPHPAPTESAVFATGHEDGSIYVWEWSPASDTKAMKPIITLRLNVGRITSITAANTGSRRIAFTMDDSAVVIWNGDNDDPESAFVLVPPISYDDEVSVSSARLSSASARSFNQPTSSWNLDRPCAVAFSRTKDHLLATGSVNTGTVTIWNCVDKVRRFLLMPSSVENKPAPIMAIGWAMDDASIVSVSEDKKAVVHNTVTGDVVWVHDLWMIKPPLNVVSLSHGARHLSAVDHDGEMTIIHLHGEWPSAATAATAKPHQAGHPIASLLHKFPPPPEAEFVEINEWDPSVSAQLVRRRTEKNERSSYLWEKSAGSGTHGHVGLLRLNDGMPRGTYEVLCEMDIPNAPEPADAMDDGNGNPVPSFVPLKFVCGADESDPYGAVEDPELHAVRGFTRLFPEEEQKLLAGKGPTTLRLGYIKAACKLDTCYIDLKRIPGPGEAPDFGIVHVSRL